MPLKHSPNAVRRVALLELCSKWVREKVVLCASLIFFQGIVENQLEFGERRGGRVGLGHNGRKEEVSGLVGDEDR